MFFRELYAVAKHTPMTLIIAPAGEQLKVIVQPRPTKHGDADDVPALQKPFVAQGTPEELDAELPASIRAYAEKVNEVRLKIEAPIAALDEAAAKGSKAKKSSAAADRRAQKKKEKQDRIDAAKKKRSDAAAKRKSDREAAAKAREDKKAAKKGAKKVGLPGATAPSAKPVPAKPSAKAAAKPAAPAAAGWPFPLGGKSPEAAAEPEDQVNHRAGLPGKAECLKDYQQLKLKHGDKLTRRLFIKKAETGRRYEKLWPNWAKFVKDAEAQGELPLDSKAAPGEGESTTRSGVDEPASAPAAERKPSARRTIPIAAAAEIAALAPTCGGCKHNVYSAPHGQKHNPEPHSRCGHFDADIPMSVDKNGKWLASAIPPGCPTFPDEALPVRGADTRPFNDVYDEFGGYLSSITTKPKVGEHIGLASQEKLLRVTAVETRPGGGLDLTVVPDPEETARRAEAIAESVRKQAAELAAEEKASEEPPYSVYCGDRTLKTSKYPFQIGERIEIEGESFPFVVDAAHLVTAGDKKTGRYRARKILPFPNRLVDEKGVKLGESEEIYTKSDAVGELKTEGEFKVVQITLDAYVVRDFAKPRWTVWNPAGEEIGTIEVEPKVGDKIDVGQFTNLTVVEVEGQDCTVAILKPRIKGPAATAAAPATPE